MNDLYNSALKTDQKETTQVISKEDVVIDDKVTINIQVQKKLISDSVTDEKPSENPAEKPSENPDKQPSEEPIENPTNATEQSSSEPPGEPEIHNEDVEIIEDIPSTPRSTPNSTDDLLQQQAADMIEQVISAASQKVEIELPELLTENILQLNRNHSSEKLVEAPEEPEAEPEAEPEVEAEAEPESLSAATSTETVVENEISVVKGIFNYEFALDVVGNAVRFFQYFQLHVSGEFFITFPVPKIHR